ncbi:hypothetical protein [Hydrocarboniphaga sp.]|uniref:hypothetical protein n=1 Tax=Hydrocarboniphaga sp. TaxID=2033016 RepID=UPI003D0E0B45
MKIASSFRFERRHRPPAAAALGPALAGIAPPHREKPLPDRYRCMLEKDPSIQPQTLAGMFW